MKLPNDLRTVVDREKITEYLLNPIHPDNGGKAEFFTRFGFSRDNWETMARALETLATNENITGTIESPHGRKYVIVGKIKVASGETPSIRTIWIVDKGADVARLVTAYPHKGE